MAAAGRLLALVTLVAVAPCQQAGACNSRRIVMVTEPRSGSSWLMSLIAARTRRTVLPLFEMFNPGFPFAHLNIYDEKLHREVKGSFAAQLIAPLFDPNSSMFERLSRGDLNAIREASSSSNRSYHLGWAITVDPDRTLKIADQLVQARGMRFAMFKVFYLAGDMMVIRKALLDECTTALLLFRNFFDAYVSEIKVFSCPGGGFLLANATSCHPRVDLKALETRFLFKLNCVHQVLKLTGNSNLNELPASREATPGHAALVTVYYEDIFSLNNEAVSGELHLSSNVFPVYIWAHIMSFDAV